MNPSSDVALSVDDMRRFVGMFNAGLYAELENNMQRLVMQHPGSSFVWKMLGASLQLQGKNALSALQKSIDLDPSDPEVHYSMGNALRTLGQLDDAAVCYRRVLDRWPDFADAQYNLANVCKERGQLEDAVNGYLRVLHLHPDFVFAHSSLGDTLISLRRYDEAMASLRRAIALKQDFIEVYYVLGNLLSELGRLEEAAESYRQALRINQFLVDAHFYLGNILKQLGKDDAAIESLRRAIELKPDYFEAHHSLGNVLLDLGAFDEAMDCYRQVLKHNPDYAPAHSNLGIVLKRLGRATEAQASCRRALSISPDMFEAVMLMAELEADQGHFGEAENLFRRATGILPGSAQAWAGIARVRKMTTADRNWATAVLNMAGQPNLPSQSEVHLRYALGKYHDDIADYDQAFSHYQRANALTKLHGIPYIRHTQTQAVDMFCRGYNLDWIRQQQRVAQTSVRPVFVVGMPRSGTSLVEQILASHPSVFGAGELTFWDEAVSGLGLLTPPEGAEGKILLDRLAEQYLSLLKDISGDTLRVVDKMPGNFLYLGLLHTLFPHARVIHMQRNPLDTCLSNYFQHFDPIHPYANDLRDLAHYYGEYVRIMAHWRQTLPEGTILDVPYEALVDDQEGWSRKMLAFIGLPWDARCMDFHQNSRAVATISHWQVRQKINKSSVERWRNYEKYIDPLRGLM